MSENSTIIPANTSLSPLLNGNELDTNDVAAKEVHAILFTLETFNYGYFPSVFVFGCFGNILTILVMTSKKFSTNTCSIAIFALALSDTTLLFCQPFNKEFFIKMVGSDVRSLSSIGCKLYYVIRRTSKMSSSWFVVYLCFEKFMAVWYPLKVKLIITKRLVLGYVLVVVAIFLAITGYWSYASDVDENGRCQPDLYNRTNPDSVTAWKRMLGVGVTLYSISPMAILLCLTPLILYKLALQRRKFKSRVAQQSSRITAMLVLIVISYIVLIIPISMVHILATYLGIKSFGTSKVGFVVFKEVAQILEQLNYSVNFFIYVLASSAFRQGLKEVLCFRQGTRFGPRGTIDPLRLKAKKASNNGSTNKESIQKNDGWSSFEGSKMQFKMDIILCVMVLVRIFVCIVCITQQQLKLFRCEEV